MRQAEIAIIGGTGLYQLDGLEEIERSTLKTRWGPPSSEIIFLQYSDAKQGHPATVAFIARHGLEHNIPPHQVNYRANLWALKACGVKVVIAVAAVGGITEKMSPQAIVIPDQILDYTYGRKQTFFDENPEAVTHIDFTWPYTRQLRERLLAAASKRSVVVVDGGVYAATQGPRLETAAEISRLKCDGADIVGMTGMPEAALARELQMQYACCALVVNWAAGRAGTVEISHDGMRAAVEQGMRQVKSLLVSTLAGFA
ncbi:S-methyl-5'-thioinosine phosphorylase [hydrothermal vent metagenome]|uniref:S-methyl-5'-thioinosine phosphorylase n=1 Tax=hydrothermal vent metagenome TaxID=652676 RepID=A0A3B0WPT9_9ZZZZ